MSSHTKKSFEYLDVWAYSNSRTEILVNVKNIGNLEAIVTTELIEGKPIYAVNGGVSKPRMPIHLKVGASETITLSFSSPLASGITNMTIRTYSGKDYPKIVVIP